MTNLVSKPGIYDISKECYHADPVKGKSLSRSIAHTIINQSPAHAKSKHPRLNPNYKPENKVIFDFGDVAHQALLEGYDGIILLCFSDYRSKAAQAQRRIAYEKNLTPILEKDWPTVKQMVASLRLQLEGHAQANNAFKAGKAEQTLIWKEKGAWLRVRPDFINENGWIEDYKTTDISNPDAWIHSMDKHGLDLQAAMYLRGYEAVMGEKAKGFRFIVQEKKDPYCSFVVELSEIAMNEAIEKYNEAVELWAWCISENKWPGHMSETYIADMSIGSQYRWMNRKNVKHGFELEDKKLTDMMLEMRAPNKQEGDPA